MNYAVLKGYISSGNIDEMIKKIICSDEIEEEKKRYLRLLDDAYELYGDGDYHFISSPGRSEIGGNHTDHQHGHVVAASLNIDNLAVVKKTDDNIVRYKDRDFSTKPVDLSDLSIHEEEYNTSESLIRGIASRFDQLNYQIGGFDALCESRVLVGSGISSSACFEVMLAEIFSALYNEDKVDPVERAKIGQYAENKYFGKPSGLLDQMAISVGGFVTIDFKDPEDPKIENYEFSFSDYGYELVLVNTKGDHSDLSHEYAAVPNEIKEVAHVLGVEYLADSSLDALLKDLKQIREKVGNDRGVLRAIHFYNEDERAVLQKNAISKKDIDSLLKLMKESGRSSFEYLQNVYPASRPNSQSLAIGLVLADMYLKEDGAYRVHGGGFEGTIQAIVPAQKLEGFRKLMKDVFDDDCLLEVRVRPFGTCLVI
ncbi:MAG: galactokinase [Erysipelotrichaceae bacterium]|nr:galactokinase [Erysipelotrichaceae bacterium]